MHAACLFISVSSSFFHKKRKWKQTCTQVYPAAPQQCARLYQQPVRHAPKQTRTEMEARVLKCLSKYAYISHVYPSAVRQCTRLYQQAVGIALAKHFCCGGCTLKRIEVEGINTDLG